MKDLRLARLLQHTAAPALPRLAPPPFDQDERSELEVGLELAPRGAIDLTETADALERWVHQRVVATGQRIALTTEHHAHAGATALRVSVPAAWVLDASTGRAGLRWSLRGRGTGVKPAHDVLGSVLVTAIGAARLLAELDGLEVRASELEVALDDRRAFPTKRETLLAVVEELGRFLRALFAGHALHIATAQDHPGHYQVHVHADDAPSLDAIIAALHHLAAQRPRAAPHAAPAHGPAPAPAPARSRAPRARPAPPPPPRD